LFQTGAPEFVVQYGVPKALDGRYCHHHHRISQNDDQTAKKKKKTIQHHNITNLIFLLGSNSKDG